MTFNQIAADRSNLGFAGAPIVDWQFLYQFAAYGDMIFFGCDIQISRRYGTENNGAASFVRANTSHGDMHAAGIYDIGMIEQADPSSAVEEIAATVSRIIADLGCMPVLVGCDHTASMAGFLGAVDGKCERLVYVYFDAHFDLGRNWATDDLLHNGGFVGEILSQRWASVAVNIGGRGTATKLHFPDTPHFVSIPASRSRKDVIATLAGLAGEKIYVSIDADVLDPSQAPNVSCPEPAGMKADDLLAYCDWLAQNCQVIGADLTEIVPSPCSQASEKLLVQCLLALKK